MREVSCKATVIVLEALEDAGVDVAPLTRDLPEELSDPSARVHWNVLVELLARVEARCGSVLTLQEIGARAVRVPSFDWLRRAGRLVMSPRQLYEIANRMVAPAMFSNVVVEGRFIAPNTLVQTGRLLPGYRESEAFFRLCHGNVVALPRVLDLPDAVIEEEVVTARTGRLVLRLPPSLTLAARVVRGARALATAGTSFRGIARQQRELEASLAALRSSREELQQVLEHLPDGVLLHRDGVVCWTNAKIADTFGEDIVGRRVRDLFGDDREAEHWIKRPDETTRRVKRGSAQVVHFDGEPAQLEVVRDVTEEHRLREQAAISDRLASIGALAAGVAHEINNPLAYVRLSLEMASRDEAVHEGSDLATSLDLAREGTDRALRIVRDLKTLSHVRDDGTEPVDLEALLDSTLALAERSVGAKARVVKEYGPAPHALGTRGKLGQVFVNLLSNAADAIPEGARSAHSIRVATRTDEGGRPVVEITDTGRGIPREIADRIFDPFFTTKPPGEGTGLGLAMCHRIVTELGGEITFATGEGKTTFTVRLLPAPRALESPRGGPA